MKRKPLQKRLAWLENGHADDPVYWIRRIRKVRRMTMYDYFVGDEETLERVGRDLNIPVDDVRTMTYGQIASRIAACYGDENRGKEAADAMWCLAAPYISVWRKRKKKNEAN